jgi:hypothetical protein
MLCHVGSLSEILTPSASARTLNQRCGSAWQIGRLPADASRFPATGVVEIRNAPSMDIVSPDVRR